MTQFSQKTHLKTTGFRTNFDIIDLVNN